MSAKLKFLCVVATAVAGAVASGCQTYDFEPVEPLAIAQTTTSKSVYGKQSKPNMMILLDKSGSMNFAADSTVPGCETCKDSMCGAGCPRTRMADLRAAMNGFLTGTGATVARVGLLPYPNGTNSATACTAGSVGSVATNGVELNAPSDSDADLRAAAAAVNTKIAGTVPFGGTPTAGSLAALAGYEPLKAKERSNFILLLTDGAPNCNPISPPPPEVSPATCRCTAPALQGNCTSAGLNQCLDKSAVVTAVTDLRVNSGIKTIVVGFGTDTSAGDAAEVLTAAALAGGMERTCPDGTDAECDSKSPPAPGSCNTALKKCLVPYYKAADGAALTAALVKIGTLVGVGNVCEYTLDATPSNDKFLTVIVDGVSLSASDTTWRYASGKVTFLGAFCDKLTNATPNAQVKVEFRIVEGL
ncbi:MAG: adventurous gliding motility lipoprotein CglB [Myxococcaceae bacterium]